MNKLGKFTSKLNFKKITIVYIILAILGIVISGFAFYNTFKDEISYLHIYNKVDEKMEHGRYNSNAEIEKDLNAIASKSDDLVDIILLDNENNIIYSAKNSDLAQSDKFTLKRINDGTSTTFELEENPNISFKVLDDDFEIENMFNFDRKQIESKHNEYKFYESMDNIDTTYFLTYEIDYHQNIKAYFINKDIEQNNYSMILKGVGLIGITCAVASLFFVVYWILLALYVYEQARKSNLNPTLWGLITLCTNLIGLLVFLIYKQNVKTCQYCGYPQNSVYCVNCGKKIKKTCPKCGAGINPSDVYCNKCGEPLNKENSTDIVDIVENDK